MTLRSRLTLAAAVAVAVAVALASALVYVLVRSELRGQLDEALEARAEKVARASFGLGPTETGDFFVDVPEPVLGGAGGYFQLVRADGRAVRSESADVALPVTERVRDVAAGRADAFFTDATVAGVHVRLLTRPLIPGVALQVTRPLTEVDEALARIRNLLLLIGLGGIGLAAGLGLLVGRTAVAPVRRLTEATEHVTQTRDLQRRIDARGRDEISRLATSFNTMLEALDESARSQRQLVADASHELRTPLTSIRTNIEVLARSDTMPAGERERLLADTIEQLAEMTALVGELVELARGEKQQPAHDDVRLDLVASGAVARVRRHRPDVQFRTTLEESTVYGDGFTIERAIGNLLDNAAKWTPTGGLVDVAVAAGEVTVRDRGPGIDDEDLPYVFDRFYRAPAARGMPGSGLGLAIVRQVAEAHGGEVVAEKAEGGGTRMRLRFPTVAADGNGARDGMPHRRFLARS